MKTNDLRMLAVAAMMLLAAGTSLRASEMDDRIESSAQKSYVFQTYLKSDAIKMESKDGVVTLSGTVNDESHRGLAQETVANLPGVKGVDNRLELKAGYPAQQSNEWLALKIKAALLFHQNVSMVNTQVDVNDGVVVLRGEAPNEAQKELTAEYANVGGVKEVKNEMTLAKAPNAPDQIQMIKETIDDASITAQVKMALLFHRATSVLETSVTTKDGVVTVSGKSKNAAEKELVTKLVSDIRGVNSVVNNMTQE